VGQAAFAVVGSVGVALVAAYVVAKGTSAWRARKAQAVGGVVVKQEA